MPMSRVFSFNNGMGLQKQYKGFDQNFHPSSRLEHVAIVFTRGETEMYAVDDPDAVSSLVKYLCDKDEDSIIAGIYSRK